MKKEISWKDLVKKTANEHKKSGTFDFKNVLAEAGKEWENIKSGKHLEYIQGKSSSSATRKNKNSKKEKKSSKKSMKASAAVSHSDCDAEMILSKKILCKSCTGKVMKLMKKQSGGKNHEMSPSEYSSSGGKNSALSPADYSAVAAKPVEAAPAKPVEAAPAK